MSNLLNIYNENFGTKVVTNGNYIAVGNPNSKGYNYNENFLRIGEVCVYKKNSFYGNYSLEKKYKFKNGVPRKDIYPYYTEQSSSLTLTASFVPETCGSYSNNIDIQFNTCSFITLEDANKKTLQNSYGSSISISNNFLVIGDTTFSESVEYLQKSGSAVDIYQLKNFDDDECDKFYSEYSLPDIPFCTITGDPNDWFGKTVAVSDKYLAIGSPNANNGIGEVILYKFDDCKFILDTVLPSPNQGQKYFGSSISINKITENTIAIGTLTPTQSMVFLFEKPNQEASWSLKQTFTADTSSFWFSNQGKQINPSLFAQTTFNKKSGYGYSVAINDKLLLVGTPYDLNYCEYSGSNEIHKRGSTYVYYKNTSSNEYQLQFKLYGNDETLKNNLFGYSVDVTDKYFIIGSPKPNFPYSSLFLSASIGDYNLFVDEQNLGEDTFCGQSFVYKWSENQCIDLYSNNPIISFSETTINHRKRIGESFSSFGYSVGISNDNFVIGSPTPLIDDWRLLTPYSVVESGSLNGECDAAELEQFDIGLLTIEDSVCDSNGSDINNKTGSIIYILDEKPYLDVTGRSFIYDFKDYVSNPIVGNVFYNNNKFIIYTTGSVLNDLLKNPFSKLDDYLYGSYKSEVTLYEKQYICTVEPGEFNISTNPTAVKNSDFEYGILNTLKFDFNNLDIILRFINYKNTISHDEKWWNVVIPSDDDVQNSIFNYFSTQIYDYETSKLNKELVCKLSTLDFDVNNDGLTDYLDAFLIWNYFIENLSIKNYQEYLSQLSKRTNFDEILKFLDIKTGKLNIPTVKDDFLNYNYNSSIDSTGSYLAPYITNVGLYNGSDLVATAKLAHPIKNNNQIPINIVVKWDI